MGQIPFTRGSTAAVVHVVQPRCVTTSTCYVSLRHGGQTLGNTLGQVLAPRLRNFFEYDFLKSLFTNPHIQSEIEHEIVLKGFRSLRLLLGIYR